MKQPQVKHDLTTFTSYQAQTQKMMENLKLRLEREKATKDPADQLPPEVVERLTEVLYCLREAGAQLGYSRKRLAQELPAAEQENYVA